MWGACRVQCSQCCKWRIVTYEALQQVSKDTSWTCRQLRSANWTPVCACLLRSEDLADRQNGSVCLRQYS